MIGGYPYFRKPAYWGYQLFRTSPSFSKGSRRPAAAFAQFAHILRVPQRWSLALHRPHQDRPKHRGSHQGSGDFYGDFYGGNGY